MLSYYIIWHLKRAWAPLLFVDEDLDAKQHRDPVAPALRSDAALAKANLRQAVDGTTTHSFSTLLAALATHSRVTMSRTGDATSVVTYEVNVAPTEIQRRAFELAEAIAL
jgi:hypothetical protein